MAKIDLTNAERLILANQYKILYLLEKDESYDRLSGQLLDGHKWLYSELLDDVSENMLADDAEHVLAILRIFDALRVSYENLEDKSGINPSDLIFHGFDGNNESDLRSFARALRRSDHFVETLGDELKNSHMPTTELYGRMISKWRELGSPDCPYSKDTILAIIASKLIPAIASEH
jgi:uncharacterized protein